MATYAFTLLEGQKLSTQTNKKDFKTSDTFRELFTAEINHLK